ncbi:MAG: hypothetical protein BWK73_44570 [Thiothrix lacustris]|uniref:Uncharacterized protein n=1 Tax=Thiothrix lacustris TaxID=525917 RepID=A0A1Y1QBA3_9GAMM|nr:MAG: hypothetical protein BWK73_44570 [Thiothrix lacustris]
MLAGFHRSLNEGIYKSLVNNDRKIQFWINYIHATHRNWFDGCMAADIFDDKFYVTKIKYDFILKNESKIDDMIIDILHGVVSANFPTYEEDFVEKSFLNIGRPDLLDAYNKKYGE